MDEPLTVTISHRLGRDEAKRRIESGLDSIRGELKQYVRSLDYSWNGYSLDFRASAMLQTISGRLDVQDDAVRIELGLPRLLHLIARAIAGRVEQHGKALLEGPKSPSA